MRPTTLRASFAAVALLFGTGAVLAQQAPPAAAPATPAAPAAPAPRTGDAYPLGTCPISGKKLGAMGEPVAKLYDGREVRFCCAACPANFEKDKAAGFAKIDEQIIKDEGPLYPLKTSLATGKELPAKPYEFVYGNRLIRLGAESEKAAFLKDAPKYIATLDKAVIEQQGKTYALKTCPVSSEALGGDMGKPVDVIVGGRLVRLCCKDCKKELEKDPAKYMAMADDARNGKVAKPGADKKSGG